MCIRDRGGRSGPAAGVREVMPRKVHVVGAGCRHGPAAGVHEVRDSQRSGGGAQLWPPAGRARLRGARRHRRLLRLLLGEPLNGIAVSLFHRVNKRESRTNIIE
eukprot:2312017-Pyramimonas_sp.AAC.1